jgi:hypothetical protein
MYSLMVVSVLAGLGVCAAPDEGEKPRFVSGPEVKADGEVFRVEFAASAPTDVAVEIMGAEGGTVRHLAAGVLGENAPEPLAKGLTQSLVWDRRDDLGRPVPAGDYTVRVGLGLAPVLRNTLLWKRSGSGSRPEGDHLAADVRSLVRGRARLAPCGPARVPGFVSAPDRAALRQAARGLDRH